MFMGVGSAYVWNVALDAWKTIADTTKKALKDSYNAEIGFAFTIGKDSMVGSVSTQLDAQNSLGDYLSTFYSALQSVEAKYVASLFDGSDNSNNRIEGLIKDGVMTRSTSTLDFSSLTDQATKMMYGKMIEQAWTVGPQKYIPFVL
jgi:hypothetical protein